MITTENQLPDIQKSGTNNINYDKAERNLSIYQTQMSCYFPFVVIPPTTTSQLLRQSKPFLWQAINLVASQRGSSLQSALDKELLQSLSEKLVIRGERSLDVLQGLLVYIAFE